MIEESEVRYLFRSLTPDQKNFVSKTMRQVLEEKLKLVICCNEIGRLTSPHLPQIRESLSDLLPADYLRETPQRSIFPCRVHRLDGTPLDIEIINPCRLANGDWVALVRVWD